VSLQTHGSLTTVCRTSDMKSYTGWMYQSVSSSYACLSTSVCMEWDHRVCRRCACRSRRWLAIVTCVLLSVDNSPFLITDSRQLAEGHSLSLARQHGTVSRRIWMITHLIWTSLNVSLNHFCFRCADNALSAVENVLYKCSLIIIIIIFFFTVSTPFPREPKN